MNVATHWSNRPEQPPTSPFPVTDGWFVVVRSGDFYSPNSWKPLEVTMYSRGRVKNRPFVSWRRGRFGFYLGWKVYGVDTENQRAMPGINPEDVFDGSIAIQGCTIRFSSSVGG